MTAPLNLLEVPAPSRISASMPIESPQLFDSAPCSSASSALPSPSACAQRDGASPASACKDRGGRRMLMRQPRSGSLSPQTELSFRNGKGVPDDYFGGGPDNDTHKDASPRKECFSTSQINDEAHENNESTEDLDLLSRLPPEIRTNVLCMLDSHADLLTASLVSRAWYKHTSEQHIWRRLFASRAQEAWNLVEQYETLWNQLPSLRKSAKTMSYILDSCLATSTSSSLQMPFLQRMEPNWTGRSNDQHSGQRHCEDGDTTINIVSQGHEEETAKSDSDASSYKSATDAEFESNDSYNAPYISSSTMAERPDWKLLYAARHALSHRWHKSHAASVPKSKADVDDYHRKDHSKLPQPLPDLPDDYRHNLLFRAQWREKYWQQNHCRYQEAWSKIHTYTPGAHYLKGHTDSVYCVRFDSRPFSLPSDELSRLQKQAKSSPMYSPLESFGIGSRGRIISGSRDQTVRIWDGDSGFCLHTLEGHSGSVLCLEYDDQVLLTGSSDMTVRVWDLKAMCEGKEPTVLHTLRGHRAGVLDLAMQGRWVISCSKDWTVRVYDRHHDFGLVYVFREHSQAVNAGSLCEYEGSVKAVTASGEGAILLWDVATGQTLKRFDGHTKGLACVKFVGNVVISGSNDWTVRVWDTRTTCCLAELRGHWDLVRAICYAPGRDMVFSAGYDGAIKMFDVSAEVHADSLLPRDKDGRPFHWYKDEHVSLPPFQAHMPRIFDVQCDGTRVLSCGETDRICVRDFAQGFPVMRLFA